MEINLSAIIDLRKHLHKNPERSDQEKQTALAVKAYINQFEPDEIVENIGGYGIAFIFKGKKEGASVLFRCELDALPINEVNPFAHRSLRSDISHKCGHDGHMAIMCALAGVISDKRPETGRIILLFQPSEENGQGAERVLNDPKFKTIVPDYVFALHNIPGYSKNTIIVKDNVFSSASIGISIRLRGKTSHASEPENGQNPATAMANILKRTEKYFLPGEDPERVKLITPIYCKLGEQAFGTNPGNAEMMFTLRASHHDDFEQLKKYLIKTIHDSIDNFTPAGSLYMEYEWVEEFPNSENDPNCNKIVLESAQECQYPIEKLHFPFRWSEDFGHFLEKYPGAIFGIGAGIDHPALHNPDYDFPDDILETGIKMFYHIYKIILS